MYLSVATSSMLAVTVSWCVLMIARGECAVTLGARTSLSGGGYHLPYQAIWYPSNMRASGAVSNAVVRNPAPISSSGATIAAVQAPVMNAINNAGSAVAVPVPATVADYGSLLAPGEDVLWK